MQSIETKFLGPTNTKGSRIKATCWLKSKTVSYNHSLDIGGNHKAAARALTDALNAERGNGMQWHIVATGENVKGTGIVAIIDLICTDN